MRTTTDSSPRKLRRLTPIRVILVGAMLITPVETAYAGEDPPATQKTEKLKRQIIASLDDPELIPKPRDAPDEKSENGFRLSKKGPIRYDHIFQIGDDEVSIKLYGPIVKKNPGLRFRIEGLHVGELPLHIEGYGNVKQGGVRFTVRF